MFCVSVVIGQRIKSHLSFADRLVSLSIMVFSRGPFCCKWQDRVPFCYWVVLHSVEVPYFFIHSPWWTSALVSSLSYFELHYYKNLVSGNSLDFISFAYVSRGGWLGHIVNLFSDIWGICILTSIWFH